MSAATSTTQSKVQLELLLPHEIDAALAARSVVYIPLGSIEYHSHHLPVGVDGLNAHGVCVRAAGRTGGIVIPTLWYGIGGGHTTYPWTIMARSETTLIDLLAQTLRRLSDLGVQVAVLFTGHFADEQLAMIDELARSSTGGPQTTRVLALSVNRTDAPVPPDHAGIFETTLLSALRPDLIHMDRLPSQAEVPALDPEGAVGYQHRHDPDHPLWGVMGPDPRSYDPASAAELLEQVVSWTIDQVDKFTTGVSPSVR